MSHAHQRVQAAIWVLERRVELAEAAALEAERERDAALERVRALEDSTTAFLDFRGLICGDEYYVKLRALRLILSGEGEKS